VTDSRATGSLEQWCRHFGPCPEGLQQALARVTGRFPTIEERGAYRVVRGGLLGGRSYTFERERLVGAQVWDDGPFGACSERTVVMYTAGSVAPASEPGTSCSIVPGRDYAKGEPCRCSVVTRKPTLANGNQGPPLRASLECLYEIGVAAPLCQPTLLAQREHLALLAQSGSRSSEHAECGGMVTHSPFQGATAACRYDAAGALVGLRWGKRYVSEGFTVCQQ
jgi:hypothetical protein